MQAFAEPERFAAPLKAFPKLKMIFGHTGSRRRFHETLAVARRHEDQVWLEFSGQPVPNIRTVLDHYDRSKIIYGSDWPYYPLAVALARFLVATEDRQDLRKAILHDNAARLLGLPVA
jgi:predicted TIM-barrel fold metal-dependent hydrolase